MTVKELLDTLVNNPNKNLTWTLPNQSNVEAHYHVTEVGKVTKHFVDCGGTERQTETCVLQLWVANDTHHRLETNKLSTIIEKAKNIINDDLTVEVEYDNDTISIYPVNNVTVNETVNISLVTKHTNCLAPEKCKINILPCCKNTGCC